MSRSFSLVKHLQFLDLQMPFHRFAAEFGQVQTWDHPGDLKDASDIIDGWKMDGWIGGWMDRLVDVEMEMDQ